MNFTPYSYNAMVSFIANYNANIWPFHILALLFTGIIIAIGLAPSSSKLLKSNLAGFLIAIGYGLAGWSFYTAFSQLNLFSFYLKYGIAAQSVIIFALYNMRAFYFNISKASTPKFIAALIAIYLIYPAILYVFESDVTAWRMPGITAAASSLLLCLLLAFSHKKLWASVIALILPLAHLAFVSFLSINAIL